MKKLPIYASLTPQGQARRLRRLAQAALVNYELFQPQLKLLSTTEHTLFRVEAFPHPTGPRNDLSCGCTGLRPLRLTRLLLNWPGCQPCAARQT